MANVTSAQKNNKVTTMAENHLQSLVHYTDFLKYKYAFMDWRDELTAEQIKLIGKGKNDIAQGKTVSHVQAKDKIRNYINNKQRS
jgi:hypothetical protein